MFYDAEKQFSNSENGSTTSGLKALHGPIFNAIDLRIMYGCRSPMLFSSSPRFEAKGQ